MAFEVVPTAAGRLHSDQYTKIIIINTPINLQSSLVKKYASYSSLQQGKTLGWDGHSIDLETDQ